jgi:hypothetical protein
MKRIITSVVLSVLVCTVSLAQKVVAEGKSYTALGDYKIALAGNPFFVKGEDCKAYVISYENSPMKVTVALCKERKCRKYVVISEKLSVQYVCKANYFGVEKLDREFEKDGYKTSDSALDRSAYFHQKVLTPGGRSELESTQLIAAFFPLLINNTNEEVGLR